jgi:hypothetical protein
MGGNEKQQGVGLRRNKNDMRQVNYKYMLYLICFSLVPITGLAVWGESVFTDKRPLMGSGVAIAFFFLYEILVMQVMDKKSLRLTPRRFVNLFMGLKAVKIGLSMGFIAIYAGAIGVETKRFALVFAALYSIYLLFDTLYLIRNKK